MKHSSIWKSIFMLSILASIVTGFMLLSGCSSDSEESPKTDGDIEQEQEQTDEYTAKVLQILPGQKSYKQTCPTEEPAPLPDCSEERIWNVTMEEKAAYFDELVAKYMSPQGHDLVTSTNLKADVPLNSDGIPNPIDDSFPEVENFGIGANDGYWTQTYLASQGFRYATCKREGDTECEQAALANIRRILGGIKRLMDITGVEGLFGRTYWDDKLLTSPPDVENDDDWHEGTGEFSGMYWKGDASKDEYAGQMFGLGVLWRTVDDEQVKSMVEELAMKVGKHLVQNSLQIIDVDGKITKHGDVWVSSGAGMFYPGFNATLALSWIKVASQVGGYEPATKFYDRCLLKIEGDDLSGCTPDGSIEQPYPQYMYDKMNLYFANCHENYNNFSMSILSIYNLIDYETNDELKAYYEWVLKERIWQNKDDGIDRDVRFQKNTLFNFIAAAESQCGLYDRELYQGVVDGICTLQRFPPSRHQLETDTSDLPMADCKNRFNEPIHKDPVPIDRRDTDVFIWTRNPYNPQHSTENRKHLRPPCDYLLAYWMGRYYNFISSGM